MIKQRPIISPGCKLSLNKMKNKFSPRYKLSLTSQTQSLNQTFFLHISKGLKRDQMHLVRVKKTQTIKTSSKKSSIKEKKLST